MTKYKIGHRVLIAAEICGLRSGQKHQYTIKTDSDLGLNCRYSEVSEHAVVGSDVIVSVYDERQRQDVKWGQQDHEPMAWMGILGEEFGELCQAVNETHFDNGPEARKKGGYENMRTEAVQVAAVAISFIEALDRHYGGKKL
ncbi:MAG: MazG-like family protein [Bacillota bacterium]